MLSSFNEASPLVIMESMACGIPNISTKLGDCKNIIGATGQLIKKENSKQLSKAVEPAILERNTQPQKWNHRRKKCRKRTEMYYNQKIMVAKYQQLWARVQYTKMCGITGIISQNRNIPYSGAWAKSDMTNKPKQQTRPD